MKPRDAEIQGRCIGMPYDWRQPTAAKVKSRYWNPGGRPFPPKVFGWGWTLNFAHPVAWIFVAAVIVACVFL